MSEELQEQFVRRFIKRFQKYNEKVLYELAQIIKQFEDVIPSGAYELAQQLKYNTTIKDLEKELASITGKSIEEIQTILEHIAKENIAFAEPFYKAKGLNVPIYEHHGELQRIVNSMAQLSSNEFINIARSTGFKLLDNNKEPLLLSIEETYHKVIDEAVYAVTTGKDSYNRQMREIIKQLSKSGVRKIEYESGYSRRIDTAVRMNVMDTIRQVSNETSKQLGKEFGADGVEISVHINPAPDHENIQGHQFSNNEFEKLQNHIDCYDYKGNFISHKHRKHDRRAISEYNCYHYVFSIVLGISNPMYSDEELQKIIDDNKKGIEIDGKHYTNYEATQLQRRIETEIRRAKEEQIIAKSAGDEDLVLKSQERVRCLTHKYRDISKQANMKIDIDRIYVPDYKSRSIKEKVTYKDVTQEWLDNATPNRHEVTDMNYFEYDGVKYEVDNKNVVLDYSTKEKEIAEWLENTFGGEIYMVPRINNPSGIQTSDYIFRKENWDLKSINGKSKQALYHAIRKKGQQSNNFIFEILNDELTLDEIKQQVQSLYGRTDIPFLKKVIIKKSNDFSVFERK